MSFVLDHKRRTVWFSLVEIANELGCSYRTVLRMVQAGDMVASRHEYGARLMVEEKELERHKEIVAKSLGVGG